MPTGRDNADSFVKEMLGKNDNIILIYSDDWVWMSNKEWRDYVLLKLEASHKFKQFRFIAPDNLDGWVMVAHRNDNALPVELRSLDDEV